MSNVRDGMTLTNYPPRERNQGHVTHLLHFHPPIISLEKAKLYTSNFMC